MPMKLDYMQTIVFILVIAALVQLLEIIIKKIAPSLYQALGVFLPLITTNCTILGVALIVIQKNTLSLLEATVYAISTAVGFTLALGNLCRDARTNEFIPYSQSHARHTNRTHRRRITGYGLYGFFGYQNRITINL